MSNPLIKIEDLAGAGKAAEKLMDVVSKACGQLYGDWIHPHAEARKTKMLSAAQTEVQHNVVIKQTEALLEADAIAQRAGRRLLIREIRRQNNIERIVSLTATEIAEKIVSDEPVNKDWATRFFEVVQDISDEKVQELWAKILAGEIKKPGSFNFRTLETLKNITNQEAKIFTERVCPLVFYGSFVIKLKGESDLAKFGLQYSLLLQMRDAGLVMEGDNTVRKSSKYKGKILKLSIGNEKIILRSTRDNFDLPVLVLSSAGRELYKIQNFKINSNYVREVSKYLKNNGFVDKESNLEVINN